MVLRVVRGSSPLAIASTLIQVARHATSNGRAMLAMLEDHVWRQRVPEPLPMSRRILPGITPNCWNELAKSAPRLLLCSRTRLSRACHLQGIAMRDPDTFEIFGVAISYPASLVPPN